MEPTPTYLEREDAQAPALELLIRLGSGSGAAGYAYLSPAEALALRGGSASQVLLTDVLAAKLRELNAISYKGGTYAFSDANIYAAVEALRTLPDRGVVTTNEAAYDLLTLGKSLEQTVEGDRKSFQIQYIDWANPENNAYHVTDEFEVEGLKKTRSPDLVLFVNGIPFVVIECKRRDAKDPLDEAISQMLRNQTREEGIPRLFHYAQLVIAAQPNGVRYATAGTPKKFWSVWKEQDEDLETAVRPLLADSGANGTGRLPTAQDKILYALCRPERLLELTHRFVVFDAGTKKIARWQQYFAVKRTMDRVAQRWDDGRRRGGVIWHTQGSGKSLTMVLLAKALAMSEAIENPRVVIVTDRVDLDDQIWKTFRAVGKEPKQANSGRDLLGLLADPGNEIVTTLVHKFDAALDAEDYTNPSDDIFLLIDEVHRTQYGRLHARMKKVLPKACVIGFTGTPLTKKEKDTADKFDGFIKPTYTIREAVEDGAVVPLLYEGRHVVQTVYKKQIDRGYDRVTEPLSEEQRKDLGRKFSSEEAVFSAGLNIERVVQDITDHFARTWQGTRLKAQIAAPSKAVAIRMHELFEEEGRIETAVVISPPDLREGYDEVGASKEAEQRFWSRMMERYGSKENYERSIISDFKSEGGVEIIIVVDKLLTGFDAPRDTVLYIAKRMTSHNLLQAIARVNRPFPGKDYGYILDYRGILGNLNDALADYQALAEFDQDDLEGALHEIGEQVDKLPQHRDAVWKVFRGVDRSDKEALERHLADEARRHDFYDRLSQYARTLQVALSSERFHQETPEAEIERYTADLRFFENLRRSVKQRYAETVDFKDFEPRIRKLIDQYVAPDEVEQVVAPVDILGEDFEAEVERVTGSVVSKADAIASRMARVARERMDEDPAFYRKFSRLIQEAINNFHDKRLMEAGAYLARIKELREDMIRGGSGTPSVLDDKPEARAYYGILGEVLDEREGDAATGDDLLAEAGIEIERIIQAQKIVDWKQDLDAKKRMQNEIEDYLIALSADTGLDLSFDEIDRILEEAIRIAQSRDE